MSTSKKKSSLLSLLDDDDAFEPNDVGANTSSKRRRSRAEPKPAVAASTSALMRTATTATEKNDLLEFEQTYADPVASASSRFKALKSRKQRRTHKRHGKKLAHSIEQALGQARMSFVDRNYVEAVAILKEVVALVPDYAPAWALLARVHEEAGDTARAIDAYKLALHADPKDAHLWKNLGHLYREMKDHEAAMHAYERATRLDPSDVLLLIDTADLFAHHGELKKAVRLLKKAVAFPSCPDRVNLMFNILAHSTALRLFDSAEAVLIDIINVLMPGDEAAPIPAGKDAKRKGSDGVPASEGEDDENDEEEVDVEEEMDDVVAYADTARQQNGSSSATSSAASEVRARLLALLEADEEDGNEDSAGEGDPPGVGLGLIDTDTNTGPAASTHHGNNDVTQTTNPDDWSAPLTSKTVAAPVLLDACNRVVDWALQNKRWDLIPPVMNRLALQQLEEFAPQTLRQLNLKAAVAYLQLGQEESALSLIQPAMQGQPRASEADALIQVASALIDVHKPQSAMEILNRLTTVNPPLDPQQLTALSLASARMHMDLQQPELAVGILRPHLRNPFQDSAFARMCYRAVAHAGTSDDVGVFISGHGKEALQTLKEPEQTLALYSLAKRARSLSQCVLDLLAADGCPYNFRHHLLCRHSAFIDLLLMATGVTMPAATAARRRRKHDALVESVGLQDLIETVTFACNHLIDMGDEHAARRLATMAVLQQADESQETHPLKRLRLEGGAVGGRTVNVRSLEEVLAGSGTRITKTQEAIENIRKLAVRRPFDIGLWNVLRVLECQARITRHSPFVRTILRNLPTVQFSVPFFFELANSCLEKWQIKTAIQTYYEIYRAIPTDPLVLLCIAVCHLCTVTSRMTENRHRHLVRTFACLQTYKRLRLTEATKHQSGGSPMEVALCLPNRLPEALLRIETNYNMARACHQVSLYHLAVPLYEECLAEEVPDTTFSHMLSLKREAAFNYVLLLQACNNFDKAYEVAAAHLSY